MYSLTPDRDARWWLTKKSVHDQVLAVANRIQNDQLNRRMWHEQWRRRYYGSPVAPGKKRRLTFNLTRSIIDTVCAKISKNKPRPQILTSGGDAGLQKKAKKLTKFLDGLFTEMDAWEKGQLVFRDACIFDGGALKIYRDPDAEKIRCERVHVGEILVDSFEAYYGQPRQMFHVRSVNRDVLSAQFPKQRRAIQDAPTSTIERRAGVFPNQSLVDVVESWHLPSAEGADDGRHTLCIDGATLVNEPYTHDDFPFVFFRWSDPLSGFWSAGLVDEVDNLQAALNKHSDAILTSHERGGHSILCVPQGAKISKSDISNQILSVLEYDSVAGQPIIPVQIPTMAPAIYQFTETLKQWGFEQTGASQTAARGAKPAGVESGTAIREVNDIETERFVLAGQRYESFYMRLAQWCIRLARDLYEDGVDLSVKSRQKRFLDTINWSDVDMDDDVYSMAMFPTSSLPTQPAGRLQTVIDMATNGLIQPDTAKKLLDFPDLEDATSLDMASSDLVRDIIDSMLDGGHYIPPEPFINLAEAQKIAQLSLLRAKMQKVSEANLEKVRTFLSDVGDLMQLAAAPAPDQALQAPSPATALPDATMPAPPQTDTMAGSMPALPGISGDSMSGNALVPAA